MKYIAIPEGDRPHFVFAYGINSTFFRANKFVVFLHSSRVIISLNLIRNNDDDDDLCAGSQVCMPDLRKVILNAV